MVSIGQIEILCTLFIIKKTKIEINANTLCFTFLVSSFLLFKTNPSDISNDFVQLFLITQMRLQTALQIAQGLQVLTQAGFVHGCVSLQSVGVRNFHSTYMAQVDVKMGCAHVHYWFAQAFLFIPDFCFFLVTSWGSAR